MNIWIHTHKYKRKYILNFKIETLWRLRWIYEYMNIYACVKHMNISINTHIHLYTHIEVETLGRLRCIYEYMNIHTYVKHSNIWICEHVNIHTYVKCIHLCIHTRKHVYMYTCCVYKKNLWKKKNCVYTQFE